MASKYVDANRLLRTRPTFSSSQMVSVAVTKLECTELFFVEPGVKVNGEYYRKVLLMENTFASDLGDVKRLLHLPAGQRPSISSKGHHCVAAT